MKTRKFKKYNDGIIKVGFFNESVDINTNELKKEFIEIGKLFFSYSAIRELDKYKFNTDLKSEIKIKTMKNPFINSNLIVKLNDKCYEIEHIDMNKSELFIFLYDYKDQLDTVIELYLKEKSQSVLEDDNFNLYKKVFSNIKNIESVTNIEKETANSTNSSKKLKFQIRYISELDHKDSTLKFKIKFKNDFYDILQIKDIDEKQKILEIEGVRE